MTWSKEVTLWCDGDCSAHIQIAEHTVSRAVKRARGRGWTSPEWDVHYCPECSQ